MSLILYLEIRRGERKHVTRGSTLGHWLILALLAAAASFCPFTQIQYLFQPEVARIIKKKSIGFKLSILRVAHLKNCLTTLNILD
jgi:hypothetical protein